VVVELRMKRKVSIVKIKQPAVAVEVDRRQPKVVLKNEVRLKLKTDSIRRWETRYVKMLYLHVSEQGLNT